MSMRQLGINVSAKLLASEAEFPHLAQNAANGFPSPSVVIHHTVALIQMPLLVLITCILHKEYC